MTVTDFPTRVEVNGSLIPDDLKQHKRWLVWRWETRGGKATKPPFRIDGSRAEGPSNPNDWVTFEEAYKAVCTGKFSGIGFVLTDDDDILAYDLDHCLNVKTGDLVDWAKKLVDKLDSYTEITPSGDGLRVIIHGDVPADGRQKRHLLSHDGQKRGAVECYKNKRYITVTGNHFPSSKLTVETRSDSVWKEFFEPDPPAIKKLTKNQKAKKLWEGDWKDDYGSQSDADLALCRYLAEATDGAQEEIDKLFRQSKLFRAKWDTVHYGDGRTYGSATIQVALSSYQRAYALTDTGDAKQFAKIVGDRVRWCGGKWYIWDTRRLAEDTQFRIYTHVDELVAKIADDAKSCDFEDRKKELIRHAKSLESRSRTEAVIALARAREPLPIAPNDLDKNPYAFNCFNGIMEKGDLRPHAFEEMMTQMSPVSYDPRADCPTWQRFLEEVIGDQEMIDYLARCVGYSMTGLVTEQVIFFVYGLGANGKSTFLNTIMYLMGDYARTISSEVLMVGKEIHPTAVADLRGIRMALANELEEGKRFNEQLIKSLTGGETIVARRMHQDFFEFEPKVKLWIMGNHKPTIRGTDYAIRRRFQLIPFTKTIPKEKQDPELKDKLKKEMEGILNWCVKGYLDWMKTGINPPEIVLRETNKYFEEQDQIAQFLTEEAIVEEGQSVLHKYIFDRYTAFNKRRNEYVMTTKAFSAKMQEKGFIRGRDKHDEVIWVGLKLKNVQESFNEQTDEL